MSERNQTKSNGTDGPVVEATSLYFVPLRPTSFHFDVLGIH